MNRFASLALGVALALLGPALAYDSLRQKSATFDEPSHLVSGLQYVRTGDVSTAVDPPPLVKWLAAKSVLLSGTPINYPVNGIGWSPAYLTGEAQRILYGSNDADTLLYFGRLPTVALLFMLNLCVFFWSRLLWGNAGAFVALLVATFSPPLLAHARLITTDLPVTALLFVATLLLALDARRVRGATIGAGIMLGLAMLAKHSGILCLPFFALVLAARAAHPGAWRVAWTPETFGQRRRERVVIGGVAFLVLSLTALTTVWSFYGFRSASWASKDPMAIRKAAAVEQFRAQNQLEGTISAGILETVERVGLLPEPYTLGLRFTLKHMRYRLSYFLGERSIEGSFWFFPVAFLVKTPIGALVLVAIGMAVLARRRDSFENPALLYLLGFPLLYFGSALFSHINIGHRHLLPIYPFLAVLTGAVTLSPRSLSRVRLAIVSAALVWIIGVTLWIHPNPLAYFNEIAGGPRGGMRFLGDSSLDWGEDLRRLRPWMEANGVRHIKLGYFGTALPAYYGLDFEWLPSVGFLNDQPGTAVPREGDVLAVSATCLQEFYFQDMSKYRFLAHYEPIDHLGYSIYLYRITPENLR